MKRKSSIGVAVLLIAAVAMDASAGKTCTVQATGQYQMPSQPGEPARQGSMTADITFHVGPILFLDRCGGRVGAYRDMDSANVKFSFMPAVGDPPLPRSYTFGAGFMCEEEKSEKLYHFQTILNSSLETELRTFFHDIVGTDWLVGRAWENNAMGVEYEATMESIPVCKED